MFAWISHLVVRTFSTIDFWSPAKWDEEELFYLLRFFFKITARSKLSIPTFADSSPTFSSLFGISFQRNLPSFFKIFTSQGSNDVAGKTHEWPVRDPFHYALLCLHFSLSFSLQVVGFLPVLEISVISARVENNRIALSSWREACEHCLNFLRLIYSLHAFLLLSVSSRSWKESLRDVFFSLPKCLDVWRYPAPAHTAVVQTR